MMTPTVKRWVMIVRISVLLAIGCMVTGGGCSKSPGGLLTVEIAEKFLADNDSVDLSQFTSIEDAAAEALGANARAARRALVAAARSEACGAAPKPRPQQHAGLSGALPPAPAPSQGAEKATW